MERMKTIMSVLFISFLPLSLSLGQEKKTEQKVKVVIADKSGTKVVIDTTFTGTGTVDSVIMKGGNVIYIGKHDSESEGKPKKLVKVITHVDKDGENSEHQYVYINDDKVIKDDWDEKFDIVVSDDEFDNGLDRTKYVIAKNGITVSIEGNDEVKVKELANEIEKKLDINKEESGSVTKEVEKKIIKKN
jgi:hypothetical protein